MDCLEKKWAHHHGRFQGQDGNSSGRDVEELINWAPRSSPNRIQNVTDKLLCWNWMLLALKDPIAELYLIIQPTHFLSPTLDHACMLSSFSHVWLFATLWTAALQVPLSLGYSRQEYWSGLPFPPPGDLPNPGVEPTSLMPPALAGGFLTTSTTLPCESYKACNDDSETTLCFRRIRQQCDSYRQ